MSITGITTRVWLWLLLALPGLAPIAAYADNYPSKPVKLVVPFAAGGSTDIVARATARALAKSLGQSFIVENRPGASGNIGAEIVAKAAADGYTLLVATTNVTLNPAVTRVLPYDPVRDFSAITMVAFAPMVLVTQPGFGGKSLSELTQYIKANPGKMNFSSSGTGGAPHLAGEMYKMGAGLEMVHVPYNGAVPAITDILTGQVQMTFTTYLSAQGLLKSGKLRALGVGSANRLPLLPEVPTFNESGFKDFEIGTMFGLVAPAKTPQDIVQKIYTTLESAAQTKEFRDQIIEQGGEVVVNTPEAYADYIAKDVEKWKRLVKQIGNVNPS